METGVNGVNGLHAVNLVVKEVKQDQEFAQEKLMVVMIAMDRALKADIVQKKHNAQVNWSSLFFK